MTTEEASALPWGSRVYLWDGSDLWYGVVHSFVEDAVNVKLVRSGHIIPLELWDPDLEDGPPYPPRSKDGDFVTVTLGRPH